VNNGSGFSFPTGMCKHPSLRQDARAGAGCFSCFQATAGILTRVSWAGLSIKTDCHQATAEDPGKGEVLVAVRRLPAMSSQSPCAPQCDLGRDRISKEVMKVRRGHLEDQPQCD
jgi:hypothetical protein